MAPMRLLARLLLALALLLLLGCPPRLNNNPPDDDDSADDDDDAADDDDAVHDDCCDTGGAGTWQDCYDNDAAECVCDQDIWCCEGGWDETCVDLYISPCGALTCID
jgi:hypothetical protein